MNCCICGRRMLRESGYWLGEKPVGPKCARHFSLARGRGLERPRPRQVTITSRTVLTRTDPRQMALWGAA